MVVSVVTKLCQQRDTRTVAESTRLDPECRFIDRPWHSWHSPAGHSSTLLWWDYLDGGTVGDQAQVCFSLILPSDPKI